MSPSIIVLFVFVFYFLGYKFYSKFLATKIFELRKDALTPAHRLKDGVDYVPTPPFILFGHHYASIAGLGPILGPAVAVIWGWLPALLWVVFGTLLIGAVHDFSALVLSIRSRGLSIGTITEYLIGKRAKLLFLLIIFFLVSLAMGVFVLVLGKLFSPAGFPNVVIPSTFIILIALLVGYLSYKKKLPIKYLGSIAFIFVLLSIWWGQQKETMEMFHLADSVNAPSASFWNFIILVYAFLASVFPVWLLLQSRDFLNSILLILGVFLSYLGFFLTETQFSAPMLQVYPKNAPPLLPFVFILIACGSISGFHALVSSGTSSKQLNKETDARLIGYGGMIGESLLGLIAILATTTVFESQGLWKESYGDFLALDLGRKVNLFITGTASFLASIGIAKELTIGFVAFIVVSFALTSLDSGTRLLRYNIEELANFISLKRTKQIIQNRYISSFLAVSAIGFFAFFKSGDKSIGQIIWTLFGVTNQLLGAIALLLASIYLYSRGKNPLYTLIPMIFLLIASIYSMFYKSIEFIQKDANIILLFISISLIMMTFWLLLESILAIKKYKNQKNTKLDILLDHKDDNQET